ARSRQPVLVPVREVGMRGPELLGDAPVVLAALVGVADQQADRRAGRASLVDAGQDLDLVLLLALRGVARRARVAPVEVGLDVVDGEFETRRTTVDDAPDRGTMGLAERGDAEEVADRVAGHR